MGMGIAPTWLRQLSTPSPLHMTTLITDRRLQAINLFLTALKNPSNIANKQ